MAGQDHSALWKQYIAKGDRASREPLILAYAPLVRYVVGRLAVTLPQTIDQDDLTGYGIIGLIHAIERFAPDRGVKFETYAITRIRGAILDELRSQDWVPRSVRSRAREIGHQIALLEASLGRHPSEQEIADAMGVAPQDLTDYMGSATASFLSLDEMVSGQDEGGSVSWIDTMTDERPGPLAQLEEKEMQDQLAIAIDALPEREKHVLALYYKEQLTLKEIGLVLGVSESRVCQLHSQAALRIRNHVNRYLGIQSPPKGKASRVGA